MKLKKEVVEKPTEPLKRLYTAAFGDLNEGDGMVSVPLLKSLNMGLYKERSKFLPKLPTTAAEVKLDGERKQTISGNDFLLVDSSTDEDQDNTCIWNCSKSSTIVTSFDFLYGWDIPYDFSTVLPVINYPYI